jgi:5,6-dimethylbenzimidazole synthase
MDIYEAIEKRRTVRSFKEGATEEQLLRIMGAGSKAPSGGNSQPWEFIIIDDPGIIDQLAEGKYRISRKFKMEAGESPEDVEKRSLGQKVGFRNASIVAVCTTSGQSASGWLAVENMSLTAVAEGLGSNIVTYWGDVNKEVQELLGLPEGYELTCVLKVGVPEADAIPPKRRPEFSWFHRNKFKRADRDA